MMQIINGKPTYTAAELDERDARASQDVPEGMIPVPYVVGGKEITLAIPDIHKAAAEALPIVTRLFGAQRNTSVNAKTLHELVGGTYKLQPWINRMIETCELVKDVDYCVVEVDIDDKDNAVLVSKTNKRGRSQTYFTTFAAGYIIVRCGGKDSKPLYAYLHAAGYALGPQTLADLEKEKKARRSAEAWGNKMEAQAYELAKKAGHGSVTASINHAQRERALEQALEESKKVSESGVQAQSLTRLVEQAARYFNKCSKNPDKVKEGAEELMTALGEIQSGDRNYYSKL